MIEGHSERQLIERRLIERESSSNSEVITIHSDSFRSTHGCNQRQSEAITYGLLDEPFGLAARQRRASTTCGETGAGTTCGETGAPSARARRAAAQDGATAQGGAVAQTDSVCGLRGGGARGCGLGGDLFMPLEHGAKNGEVEGQAA